MLHKKKGKKTRFLQSRSKPHLSSLSNWLNEFQAHLFHFFDFDETCEHLSLRGVAHFMNSNLNRPTLLWGLRLVHFSARPNTVNIFLVSWSCGREPYSAETNGQKTASSFLRSLFLVRKRWNSPNTSSLAGVCVLARCCRVRRFHRWAQDIRCFVRKNQFLFFYYFFFFMIDVT